MKYRVFLKRTVLATSMIEVEAEDGDAAFSKVEALIAARDPSVEVSIAEPASDVTDATRAIPIV